MAQQIKKKFLSPEVIEYFDNQIDSVEQSVLSEQSRAEGQEAAIRSEFAAADLALDQKIDGNYAIYETDIELVRSDITANSLAISQEISDRQSGDSALDARITTLEGQVGQDLQAAITALQAADSAEQSAREAADLVLDGKIETEKARIDAILLASDADKDSFAEIVQLINSVDTENDSAFASYVLSNDAALAQEVSDRQAGDSALDSRITTLEGQVSTDLQNAITQLQSDIAAEASTRQSVDEGLDSRIIPMEEILEFEKAVVFENNANVYADSQPGVEDANHRPGWYYENLVAGQKINWYFFDGVNQANIQKQDFSMYAVVTMDSAASLPIMAIYTYPTGVNDFMPGFAHSRYVYSTFSSTPVVGKKYLFYVGQEPTIFPELPRIQINQTISNGEQLPTERVLTASFGTNSGAAVGNVKLVAEHLGVYSPSYKGNAELRIRTASVVKLEAEEAARIASDANLQSQIDALNGTFATDSELSSAVLTLEGMISVETSSRESAVSGLDSRLQTIEAKGFSKGSFVVGVELGFIDLDREYETVLSVSVGRLAVHEGEDYTVSVVGGKTRLTWINSLANPSGEEKIETGDKVFWSGSY